MSHHKKPVQALPPRDKLFLSSGILEDEKCSTNLKKAIARQPFMSRLDLLVQAVAPPAANDDLPEEVKRIIENYTFSHTRINPADLLIPSFMHGYIRDDDVTPRSLVLLSGGDFAEDVIAIDGTGQLVLSLCKDTHSILGLAGHMSHFGPKRDRYYLNIDLRLPYMRDGKPGYEKLKTSLRKLGDMDIMIAYTEGTAHKPGSVTLPGNQSKVRKPRINISQAKVSSTGCLLQLQKELNSTSLAQNGKKRKRDSVAVEEGSDYKTIIPEMLEAVGLIGLQKEEQGSDTVLYNISIEGMLHPQMAVDLLQLGSSETIRLISLTAHYMPHSPVYRPIKRNNKTKTAGNEERPIDSATLDGWTLLFGTTDAGGTRFILCDSCQ